MQSGTLERRVCPDRLAGGLFALCTLTYIIALFGRMSYSAVMAELISGGGFTKSQAGLVGTMMFASYGLCQVLSGFIGDKIAPRVLIFTGTAGSAVLNLLMGLTHSLPPMLVLWTLNGAFQSLIWSPIARVLAEIMPPAMRKRACANIGVAYPTATILAYLAAALLLRFARWNTVFFTAGASMLVVALVWFVRMGYYERETRERGAIETIVLSARKTAVSGSLWRILLVSGALFAAFGAMTSGLLRDGIQSWMPTFMTERFGMATSLSVGLAIALPVVNIIGVFGIRWLYEHRIHNEMRGAAAFFGGGIVALALLVPLSTLGAAASSVGLMTLASTCMMGASTMFISFMPIHFGLLGKASSATGVLNCASYVGSALSSYGIGKVAEFFGWNAAIVCWLGFALAALLLTRLGARKWQFFISDEA